mmetsp:Transcript_4009/g.25198  ORF Transcript_4009/g.25198 Transcript_4009/m.25198 type:complete len:374 (+) Transcript_4009:2304-3425(+)
MHRRGRTRHLAWIRRTELPRRDAQLRARTCSREAWLWPAATRSLRRPRSGPIPLLLSSLRRFDVGVAWLVLPPSSATSSTTFPSTANLRCWDETFLFLVWVRHWHVEACPPTIRRRLRRSLRLARPFRRRKEGFLPSSLPSFRSCRECCARRRVGDRPSLRHVHVRPRPVPLRPPLLARAVPDLPGVPGARPPSSAPSLGPRRRRVPPSPRQTKRATPTHVPSIPCRLVLVPKAHARSHRHVPCLLVPPACSAAPPAPRRDRSDAKRTSATSTSTPSLQRMVESGGWIRLSQGRQHEVESMPWIQVQAHVKWKEIRQVHKRKLAMSAGRKSTRKLMTFFTSAGLRRQDKDPALSPQLSKISCTLSKFRTMAIC